MSSVTNDLRTVSAVLDAYLRAPSAQTYEGVATGLAALNETADGESHVLYNRAQMLEESISDAHRMSVISNIVVVIVAMLVISATGFITGRRLQAALLITKQEQADLLQANRAVKRRNEQLQALYQIVTEVAESLSLEYVVATTVRETRKLLAADVAILRLVAGGELKVTGVDNAADCDLSQLAPVQLGEGVLGRCAKRGKTMLIAQSAEQQMHESERIAGMETVLVVPLIVGAQVVGTLACWSSRQNAFSADDQFVLELMASQVATAVAAATIHAESEEAAHHDALTGLPNRRQLADDGRSVLAAMIRDDRPFAVVMADIDHFKKLNDDYGHRVGDITLQRVAQALRSSLREGDRIYRYGGEEFVMILPDTVLDAGARLTERVRTLISQLVLTGDNLETVGPVTISAGVAAYPDHAADLSTLIKMADKALYRSKESGRNRVTVFGDENPDEMAA